MQEQVFDLVIAVRRNQIHCKTRCDLIFGSIRKCEGKHRAKSTPPSDGSTSEWVKELFVAACTKSSLMLGIVSDIPDQASRSCLGVVDMSNFLSSRKMMCFEKVSVLRFQKKNWFLPQTAPGFFH